MNISDGIQPITQLRIYEVLSSTQISDEKKADFIRNNAVEIKNTLNNNISKDEFNLIMSKRPLIKFRPFKNSFTKKGDDIILSKSLGIDKKEINKYINSVIKTNFETTNEVTNETIDEIKTYVYRHGNKDQVLAFLKYELSDVKNTLNVLYHTLDNNSGGIAGYFSRPIHKLDNRTMSSMYKIIDNALKNSYNCGYIDDTKFNSASKWALVRIYQIQNDQKILKAYNLYKDLQL